MIAIDATGAKDTAKRYPTVVEAIALLALLLLTGWWFAFLWVLRSPAPFADDFELLSFISRWVQSPELSGLWQRHNEHTQLILRSFALLSYLLTGQLSFYFLTFFSLLLGLTYPLLLIYTVAYRQKLSILRSNLLLLPAIVLLLQPGPWESYLWVTCGFTHALIPLLMLLAAVAVEHRRYVAAGLTAVLAALTAGAGLFVIPILGLMYGTTKVRLLLVSAGLLLLSLVLLSNSLLLEHLREFLAAPEALRLFGLYTLAFVGNYHNVAGVTGALIGGLLFCLALLYLVLTRKDSRALLCVGLLVLCAGAASAALRAAGGGLEHALLSRYQVFPLCGAAALYAAALKSQPAKGLWLLALVAALGVAVNNYSRLEPKIRVHYLEQNIKTVQARFDAEVVLGMYPPRSATDRILNEAEQLGVYTLGWDPQFFERQVQSGLPLERQAWWPGLDYQCYRDEHYYYVGGSLKLAPGGRHVPRRVCLGVAGEPSSRGRMLCVRGVWDRRREKLHFHLAINRNSSEDSSDPMLVIRGRRNDYQAALECR